MAYNTRRGGGRGYMTASAASVGQRRPGMQQQLGNNFVPGGQLAQHNKPLVQPSSQQLAMQRQQQMQQVQQPKPQQPPVLTQRQQQLQQVQQQQQEKQQQQMKMQQQAQLRQQAQQFVNQQQQQPPPSQPPQQVVVAPPPQHVEPQPPVIAFKSEAANPVASPTVQQDNTNGNDVDASGDGEGVDKRTKRNKPFWMRKDGKINKKERLRRRNQRLRKILQPKNALMVLNELIGSAPYNVTESADMYEGTIFRCTVQVDGLEHVGVGKSKPSAKTSAAEAALKYMVLSKLKNSQSLEAGAVTPVDNAMVTDADGDIKMDMEGDDNLGGISWSHVACYALHKLLSSWDEGTNLAEKLVQVAAGSTVRVPDIARTFEKRLINSNITPLLQLVQAAASGGSITTPDRAKTFEKRPAKKLPESAPIMNPIMLLNQMHPTATYEEVAKSGNPPHVQFTVKCIVNGDTFYGSGSTKKGARKMCAFAACQKVLGIQYAPAFLEEHGFSEDAVSTSYPVNVAPVQVV